MEENSNLLNETISSWIDDEDLNKKIDVGKLNKKSEIKGGYFGKKFCLQNDDNKEYFNKEINKGLEDYDVNIALYSAFVSCFSHTPYPICKNKFQYEYKGQQCKEDFILYRFDNTHSEDNTVENDMITFFNNDPEIWIEEVKFEVDKFRKLSNRAKKNIIQLYIHMIFFNMFDRKFQNLLFCNNGMHYVDLDFNTFMFDTMSHGFTKKNKKYVEEEFKKYVEDLSNAFLTDRENVKKYIELEINKIKNINFETFIERYIGRCLALDVNEDRAFDYLNDNFITRINEYYIGDNGINNNNKTIFSTISEEINSLIKKGIEEVWNNFSKQMNKLKYMTDKELFNKKFEEIKTKLKKEKQQLLITNNIQYENNDKINNKVETSNDDGDTIINENSVYSISEDKIGTNKAIMITGEESTNGCGCCGINLNDINPFRLFQQK